MPGVSGDENVNAPFAPGAICGGFAKLPGLVWFGRVEGFPPMGGSEYSKSFAEEELVMCRSILVKCDAVNRVD
ncbi:hypothetical protein PM8797T_07759 [Gimesia maris DSM 8797]|jgi:hypothetical protein|uniref:Uncharacterized protein n=1 Tax=Gimesia maris TaxID=122 RepID=A0A3D3RF91_9PLAN|nr:hypothetical protein PM8797T_07759 [Gimesia maris DSM 8797]MAC51537.1 hypothetical protein [Gimesia sp.]HCO26752.1 hypothetical protein [Gimesia maris]|tara:strand:+ start:4089 stop:4307 length:219 start_codon:yes stop_codon:yes gene_type:complete